MGSTNTPQLVVTEQDEYLALEDGFPSPLLPNDILYFTSLPPVTLHCFLFYLPLRTVCIIMFSQFIYFFPRFPSPALSENQ
jgi:hypothetical protein